MKPILWTHFCKEKSHLFCTWLDNCPFCGVEMTLPRIQPELIDILHDKIRKEESEITELRNNNGI